jgi:hypothetical protein
MKKGILVVGLVATMISAPVFSIQASSSMNAAKEIIQQEELSYTKISTEELPQEVSDAIAEDYPDYSVVSASKATTAEGESVYKVAIKNTDNKVENYFFNSDGTPYNE